MDFNEKYLTFDEYKELGGTLSEMPFNLLEFKARKEIDDSTFGRLKNLKTQVKEVKLCDYELINELNSIQPNESNNKAIASESTDGYSVTYQVISSEQIKAHKKEIKSIINTYLSDCKIDGIPYLYRG